ncbi:MAG: hypothetical protein QOI11_1390 [Candidatus Eremiobacteraeota bacterium]|jgi:hypothetical protein|nr:hypothetical protein [Candidatus Eremiobacteraeota bacterium]
MKHAVVTGAVLVLCSTLATAPRPPVVPPRPSARPSPAPKAPSFSLYSTHARRLVQAYLRLRLLETREADLERARKVIERRLGANALFGETPPPYAR